MSSFDGHNLVVVFDFVCDHEIWGVISTLETTVHQLLPQVSDF